MLETVEAVIEALGGSGKTAAITGVTAPAVSNWKERGRIPSDKYFAIAAHLKGTGKEVSPVVFGAAPVEAAE